MGDGLRAGKLSHYVITSHPGQLSLPSLRGRYMSISCSWEGKGRYGSFRMRMNVWVCQWNCEIPWEHVPYLSAFEVMIHEEALYQVYASSLPLPLGFALATPGWLIVICYRALINRSSACHFPLTVKHILIECLALISSRNKHFTASSMKDL